MEEAITIKSDIILFAMTGIYIKQIEKQLQVFGRAWCLYPFFEIYAGVEKMIPVATEEID